MDQNSFRQLKLESSVCGFADKVVGMDGRNRSKNRYYNIIPLDHYRFKYSSDTKRYINASYIGTDFIQTQGPMSSTIRDFWDMCIDNMCVNETTQGNIIMLTDLIEKEKVKCEQYWPNVSETLHLGEYIIKTLKVHNLDDNIIVRTFTITHKDKQYTITQYHLPWKDFGVPNNESRSSFIRLIDTMKREECTAPSIIHCSAGVGRTGMFLLVHYAFKMIRETGERVNVYKLLLKLRKQCPYLVQTGEQYKFCVDVISKRAM